MNKTGSIYIIKNKINDKVYVGQTTQKVEERFKQHLKRLKLETKKYKIYDAMRKYGKDNFYFETIKKDIPLEKLNDTEIYYIEKYNSYYNGYNSTLGGDGRSINKDYDEVKILKLYSSGKSSTEIANIFNVNSITILRVLKKLNVVTRKDGNKYKQFNKNEFIKQWKSTTTIEQMAKYFKCDKRTITRNAKRLGLPKKTKRIERDEKGRFTLKKAMKYWG